MQRTKRLLNMVRSIDAGRHPTREQWCAEFEVKTRTVDSDVEWLKEYYYGRDKNGQENLYYDTSGGGYVCRDPHHKLPQFELDPDELFVLTLGRDLVSRYTGKSFEAVLVSALDKINERLPEGVSI